MKRGIAALFLGILPLFLVNAQESSRQEDARQENAQEIEDILRYLKDKIVSVHIITRLIDQDEESVWDAESTQLTVAGRAVKLRLEGEGIVINTSITPFGGIEDTLLLVAQGEVLLSGSEDEGVKYESFLKSLPVEAGEKIIFFPLGVVVDAETNIYTVQLEIQVFPYQEKGSEE